MEKMIWHNKIEYPDTEEGLFVYVFDRSPSKDKGD